jgi:hypothetical protein
LITPLRKEWAMKNYEFDVVLRDVAEVADEQADALYEAGCDDGTPVSRDGVAWLHFDRTAPTLEKAIRSAVMQIQSAGMFVVRVEITGEAAAALMR